MSLALVVSAAVLSAGEGRLLAATPNLVEDPGFEAGTSNFAPTQATNTVGLTRTAPIVGAQSLLVGLAGPGQSVVWRGRTFAAGQNRRFTRITASGRVVVTIGSASYLKLCALVGYANGTNAMPCRVVSGAAGSKGTLSIAAALDPRREVARVRIGFYQQGTAPLRGVIADAMSVVLDEVAPSPTPSPSPSPQPSPVPSPSPSTGGYPGYTYDLPTVRPFLSLADSGRADRTSPAYLAFKSWVDDAVAGRPGYDYSATDSVILYSLTRAPQYIQHAVAMVDRHVLDADAAIRAGRAPAIARDSYLEVGPFIEQLALAYDYALAHEHATGVAVLSLARRQRWAAYAEQTLFNVWNPGQASWGGRPFPWSGWSIDNPGNNYHFSFLRATQYWALASQNRRWLDFLQARRFPALVGYYAGFPGGGSREGTGYGTAQKNLFENHRIWKASTGEDLAALTPHARGTIDYWIHASTPGLQRFAPFGDQARVSEPEIYDYQEHLMRELVVLNRGSDAARRGVWWLNHNAVPRMQHGFNFRHGLLAAADAELAPTQLVYHAAAAGHFFARSSWAANATWLAFAAGRYDESHAHQEQGGFTLFKNGWLAVTSNIWSRSGIEQGVENHNVIRFERSGQAIPQTESTSVASSMSYATGAGGLVRVSANLANAYPRSRDAILGWTRELEFQPGRLRVHDACSVAAGVRPVWQLHVPVEPLIQQDGSIVAGGLRIVPVTPADPVVDLVRIGCSAAEQERGECTATGFNRGWRVELTRSAGCEFTVDLVVP